MHLSFKGKVSKTVSTALCSLAGCCSALRLARRSSPLFATCRSIQHTLRLWVYNAPDSMRQMSASYSPSLPCHLPACCILSCHHVHLILHTCSSLASELFPVVRFAIRHSYVLRRPPFASFRVRVLNGLRMERGLPSGLGIAPVDRLSSFVPFGGRLILQRLTG